ncbi:pre-mRNA cleavage complex II Clp1-like protein [Leptomonas seymouri]|uniref:Pre-mRNA cleavage complex II Clp1-like protein n=1 Tax=Leptomonas seymouri TaxID=5684 RepID=A0A0N1HT73_LEPSE|nr:pre-mRNA cleavage complex II Clp1-like protein [Leptomonas seymouri]|eukprot:KPI84094.1 pre-mRNA cleavage complex II Clp1-like protein [Leptomonas seymouri]
MEKTLARRVIHLTRESVTIQWPPGQTGGAVVLLSGRAELHRSAVIRNLRYSFPAESCIVIEAFDEAVLQLEGAATVTQVPLNGTLDEIHALLDTARADAAMLIQERETTTLSSSDELKDSWQGPRVLVVGENMWERETVARSLLNLAVRRGSPYGIGFVDVDVAMPLVGCPGTVSAVFVEEAVAPPEDFDVMMPLTFFHGTPSVTSVTRKRYLDLCACLAQAATSLGFSNAKFEAGGLLIRTMSPGTEIEHDLLSDLMSIFAVTHVVVTGANYDLERFLLNSVLGRSVTFLRTPKMAGVVPPSSDGAAQRRHLQLEHYLFGTPRAPRLPVRGVARLADLELLHTETYQHLDWSEVLDLSLASVVWADTTASAVEANVAGFVVLLEVGKEFVSFLAPSGGELPKPFLLVSPTLQLPRELVMPLYATESS